MSNTILLKRSGNVAAVPLAGNLTLGELSLNYADGVLYFLNSSNQVTVLANANTVSGTQLVNGTSNVVTRASGNVTVSSAGTANVLTVTGTGIAIVGTASATGNVTGGNILTAGQVSATGNVTGNYFIGNGSQLTGVTATAFAPVMFNDVSSQTNGNTAVFALLTDQTAVTGITNSKQLQVTVNGAVVTPYINSWTWPFFTTYYRSYPGFRVTNLGYGLTANSVVIYNAPAVSSQVTITQLNTSTDSQLRRYPYSATAIAIGD